MIRPRLRRRLVLLAFAVAIAVVCAHLVRRALRERSQVTLRFAHWQLEPGIREAFDAIARDYEALHPGVRVEQMPIPERIYQSWGLTQLVGGAAPDLIELGKGMGGPDAIRHFRPITAEIELPNPYNAGTPLAATAWRNTFADGMESGFAFDPVECYGASVFAATSRLYCNVTLLREITGGDGPPRTFEQLLALGETVRAHAARTGRPLALIAGSRGYAAGIFDDLLRGQLQRLAGEMNPGGGLPADTNEMLASYLAGRWSVDHPGLRGATNLLRLLSQQMSPGFLQASREDALFQFAQGRALLFFAFSQDATGIRRQVGFPLRVFRLPAPQPAATGYGANLLGPNADGTLAMYGAFGIARSSRHPELALDFLRYLTSQPADRKFARLASTLPVITGIEPAPEVAPFMPDRRGHPSAPMLVFLPTTGRAFLRRLHLLCGPDGDTGRYLDSLRTDLAAAMRTDLANTVRGCRKNVVLADTAIESAHRLSADPALVQKLSSLTEAQNDQEATAAYLDLRLRQTSR